MEYKYCDIDFDDIINGAYGHNKKKLITFWLGYDTMNGTTLYNEHEFLYDDNILPKHLAQIIVHKVFDTKCDIDYVFIDNKDYHRSFYPYFSYDGINKIKVCSPGKCNVVNKYKKYYNDKEQEKLNYFVEEDYI